MMRYFMALFGVRLRSMLRFAPFLAGAAFLLFVTAGLAAVLPQQAPLSLRVGLLATESGWENAAADLLAQNTDYEFVRYRDAEVLERAVLKGALHCAYLLGTDEKTPVTVLATDASFMRPLLDEVVLSVCFDARIPETAEQFLNKQGLDGAAAAADFDRLRAEERPMTVELISTGKAGTIEGLAAQSVQPLLYAVLFCVFPAVSVLTVLLSNAERAAAMRRLAAGSGRPVVTALAPAAADALLGFLVLLAADLLMNLFVRTSAYALEARLAALCVLAVFTALLCALPLRRFSGAILLLLPPAVLLGVFCSGALVSPELLPAGIGVLRFLSPAWYGLQLLGGI